jgi:hypothetical protein
VPKKLSSCGGVERLEQWEWSDWSRGSGATEAGGAKQLEQEEQSDYSRGSGATGVRGTE